MKIQNQPKPQAFSLSYMAYSLQLALTDAKKKKKKWNQACYEESRTFTNTARMFTVAQHKQITEHVD